MTNDSKPLEVIEPFEPEPLLSQSTFTDHKYPLPKGLDRNIFKSQLSKFLEFDKESRESLVKQELHEYNLKQDNHLFA